MADDAIPPHFASTLRLLRAGFPNGIPDDQRHPLMAVMRGTGMSDRSIADALGLYWGVSYVDLLHDVATCESCGDVDDRAKAAVEGRLRPFGFDDWAKED